MLFDSYGYCSEYILQLAGRAQGWPCPFICMFNTPQQHILTCNEWIAMKICEHIHDIYLLYLFTQMMTLVFVRFLTSQAVTTTKAR